MAGQASRRAAIHICQTAPGPWPRSPTAPIFAHSLCLPPRPLAAYCCLASESQQQLPFIAGSLRGLRSCCTLFQSVATRSTPAPATPSPSPSTQHSAIFSVSGLFLPCTMSVGLSVCVCVCARAFVCKCGHLISICVLDCFALHLLIFAI